MFVHLFIPFLHNEIRGFLKLELHTEHNHFELVTSGFYYYLKKTHVIIIFFSTQYLLSAVMAIAKKVGLP